MIEFTTKRYYKSIYHDPVFDGYMTDFDLDVDQVNNPYNIIEFESAQVGTNGKTFGVSPYSQSSNLRVTSASGNPAAGTQYFAPKFFGDFPASLMKTLANNNKSYVLFAVPMGSTVNDDTVYMVGYYTSITWAGGSNQVLYYFKVAFIKNSYNPDTATQADFLYTSGWDQRTCAVVDSTAKLLFGFTRITAKNDQNQFITQAYQEGVSFQLDNSVLVFISMYCDASNNTPNNLPVAGSTIKYQITSNNRALQAATQPGTGISQTNAGLMFVAPAYVEYQYDCKIDYNAELISNEVGEASTPGGYEDGTFEYEHDQIDLDSAPSIGMSTSGMYHVYRVYQQQLSNIGAEILQAPGGYTPQYNTGNDEVSAIKEFSNIVSDVIGIQYNENNVLTNNGQLLNFVIDLHMIPVEPLTTGVNDNIKVGWRTLNTVGTPVTSDYVDVSCGSVSTKEFYGMFADYLTRIQLFLPFVGFVPVHPEWFQNATISIDYRFNVIDGSFMCYVRGYGQHLNKGFDHGYKTGLLAQYSGAAAIHMPITGANYAAMMGGQLAAVGGVLSSAAYGNVAGAAGSAISAIMMKPDIAQSNAYSSSSAVLSQRTPFFMISRPTSHYSALYQHELGLPANITARLGDLSGFVQMTDVHLDGIRGTAREKAIIAERLAKGVIV